MSYECSKCECFGLSKEGHECDPIIRRDVEIRKLRRVVDAVRSANWHRNSQVALALRELDGEKPQGIDALCPHGKIHWIKCKKCQ
jgi:hypothetical protein